MESVVYVDTRPPYPEEIARKPYPANYMPPLFPKYDGITGNTREHIRQYVDALTDHSHDHELRFREFSKSLEGQAFTWCMLYEYRPYLKNLQISSFTRLVEAARRTSMSVRKPSKGSTSQAKENKKVEVAVTKEPKKVTKGKKRDRGGIPPPFTVSTEELYSMLVAWVKDGVVMLPECKHEPTEEGKRNPFYCRLAKGDLVIKAGKRADPRMRTPAVVRTFFIGHKELMEEEAENMASNSLAPPPLVDEEMVTRI
nr:hypothetical protein CFP56_38061 [Quercus suber]